MSLPQWADAELSAELPRIREAGESASVKFKEDFPVQAHGLAKELAAFGTSGGGTAFIGVNYNSEVTRLNAPEGETRDDIVERAQGIVSVVRPALSVDILFTVEQDKTLLVIRVPKQDHPVFYYEDPPYIRDGRRSRRATPEEVQKQVWAHPSEEYYREGKLNGFSSNSCRTKPTALDALKGVWNLWIVSISNGGGTLGRKVVLVRPRAVVAGTSLKAEARLVLACSILGRSLAF